MGESIRRVLILCQFRTRFLQSVCIHTCAVASHSLLHHCFQAKTQAHPGEQSANSQQQRDRRNRNVLQMSIAIVTVFVFCWLPYSINFLVIWYQDTFTHLSCSFWIYHAVTGYMTNAYCAINPVICFLFSSNYRKALKRLIKYSFVQA